MKRNTEFSCPGITKRSVSLLALVVVCAFTAMAQAPRVSYGIDNYSYGHEQNPAVQPDSSYWSLPLLGGTSVSLSSTMKMGDILFDKSDGAITTFMNSGTISKSDLMDRVGKGLNTSLDTRLTLLSIGRRINDKRYQTYSLTWRTQADVFADKGLFDVMKEVANRSYTIDKTTVNASSYLELAFGESRHVSQQWTVGLKAKVLLGIINANATLNNMTIDLSTGKWVAQGKADMNLSGIEYKTKEAEYKGKEGVYNKVYGFKLGSVGLHGIGVGIDAGATYKPDNHWTFSAAVLDLGFISWFKSHKAENSGSTFVFDGFHDVSGEGESEKSLESQWNNIYDNLMDMAHLEETTTGSNTRMLACTVNAGATYRYDRYSATALFTSRIYGRNTSYEGRLNLNARVVKPLDITISPAYSTYGFALGAMLLWRPGHCQVYVASDRLFTKMNKQCIPTSLNTTINFGMTLPM